MYRSGFKPLYDGYIRFTTASFGVSRSLSALGVRDKLFHNLEWLYGTHTQIRVNWTNQNPLDVGSFNNPMTPGSASLIHTEGPFILSMTDEGQPMPLYVRMEAGPKREQGNIGSGSIKVHLRQNDLLGAVFSEAELGSVEVNGATGDKAIYEFTTLSSSLSTSSSLLEIEPSDVRPLYPLSVRTTRSLTQPDEKVQVLLCWLDFYGVPDTGSDPVTGYQLFSVFAQEFCPRLEDL